MGGLSSLSLARICTDSGHGCSHSKPKGDSSYQARSSSNASRGGQDNRTSATRSQSMSRFCLCRSCTCERSSSIGALAQSDVESDTKLTHDRLCSAPPSDDKSQGDSSLTTGAILKKNLPIMTSSIPSPKPILRPTPSFPWTLLSQILSRYSIH